MRSRTFLVCITALALAGGVGCSSRHGVTPQAGSTGAPETTRPTTAASGSAAPSAAATRPAAGSSASASSATAPKTSDAASTPGAGTSPSPSAHTFSATPQEVPIDAKVTPACVLVGGKATLHVHSVSKAAIAFVAVYAGEKSGAAPPWGEGYGGNEKGTADGKGNWSSSWTVALNAPKGPAHVILVVGSKGKHRQIDVPFSVGGREAGGCGT
ncbi:MAG: hypothetical protein QOE45_2434 [Frankiaceae bacterium]|jgi:hypothetical protein|nr:hypothetical protein [Frankiaceae bacterium]